MSERLVIIGGVAAGMSAAAKARRANPALEITVYERTGYISYGACGFPFYLSGDVADIRQLLARTPAQMADEGIDARVHHEVLAIDPQQQTVLVCDHASGLTFSDHWDRLIIAAGASTALPPIPGARLPGVFTLRTTEDALAIKRWLQEEKPQHGVIIGGSYIGLEMADVMLANGITATIVDNAPQVMSTLDADMAAFVLAHLQAQGVTVSLDQGVSTFIGPAVTADIVERVAARVGGATAVLSRQDNGRLRIREVVTADNVFPAGIVVFGIGSRPNVALARAAGIAIGCTGAIAVDEQQRTNLLNIWAAGAAAETYHRVARQPVYIPLATTASKQGRVAGVNAAGGQATFAGVVGTSVVRALGLTIAHTGLNEKTAQSLGINSRSVFIEGKSRAGYMPHSQPLRFKLVYEAGSQKLLGGQMLGGEGVAKRIDVLATALHAGYTTHDLAELDLSYTPPVAPLWDPILIAANLANR